MRADARPVENNFLLFAAVRPRARARVRFSPLSRDERARRSRFITAADCIGAVKINYAINWLVN